MTLRPPHVQIYQIRSLADGDYMLVSLRCSQWMHLFPFSDGSHENFRIKWGDGSLAWDAGNAKAGTEVSWRELHVFRRRDPDSGSDSRTIPRLLPPRQTKRAGRSAGRWNVSIKPWSQNVT
jgi:hypothetical protein